MMSSDWWNEIIDTDDSLTRQKYSSTPTLLCCTMTVVNISCEYSVYFYFTVIINVNLEFKSVNFVTDSGEHNY